MRDAFLLWGQRRIEKGALVLAPLSFLWAFSVWLKNIAYDRGWLLSTKVNCLVISIGNIVAGGSGKTPLVELLARRFSSFKVAILSRGYGSEIDEPLLLQKRAPFARVYVGKDRVALAKQAEAFGAELIIIDDGLQYRKLHRDLELIVLKGSDPWGKGHYLPWGFLRDSPKRLKNADCILASGQKIVGVEIVLQMQLQKIVNLQGGELASLQGLSVSIFSGIANPQLFRETVEKAGAIVLGEWVLADHAKISLDKLACFARDAKNKGANALICTEKDAVKLAQAKTSNIALPIYYLEMSFTVASGMEIWENLIAKIEKTINTYVCEKRNSNRTS